MLIMKRIIMFLIVTALLCVSKGHAQSEKAYFYGVDFSKVKVYGAGESVDKFAEAFEKINILITSEADKYDFSKLIGKDIESVLSPVLDKLSKCKYEGMKTYDNVKNDINFQSIVNDYKLPQKEGRGYVLVAVLLDKGKNEAVYNLLTFDIESRKIINSSEVVGKPGGFGLRNFWAGSLYKIINGYKLDDKGIAVKR